MNTVRRILGSTLATCALTSAGCFGYTPVRGASDPNTRVGIDLTVRAQADYESKLGAGVDRVEGVIEESTPDSARIAIDRTRARSGSWTYWRGEAVVLPTSAFARIEERKLSATRTVVAVGSVAAVAARVLTTGLFGIGGHDRDPNPRPLPPVQPGLRR